MSIKKPAIVIITVFMVVILAGCNSATPTPAAVPLDSGACTVNPVSGESELHGLWIYEIDGRQNMLTVTDSSLYLVEVGGSAGSDSILERYYKVESADWDAGVLELTLVWERQNGSIISDSAANQVMSFKITDGSLTFSLGDEPVITTADLTSGPWVEN